MATRSDGMETRERLLGAALEVFAARGFHDVTIAEISDAAGANVASVNYHFGGKEQLYAEVWSRAFADAQRRFPVDGGVPATASAERRLRGIITSMLCRVLRHGPQSQAGRILLQDMARPVEAIREVRHQAISNVRKHIELTILDLLGPEASEMDVRHCVMSVAHQCLSIGFRGGRKPPSMGGGTFNDDEINDLIEHVHRFSLGGIRAVRRHLKHEAGVAK